mmetsp:Transcript_135668/g.329787  ORF Transcript_135668/g.329787 Transcript_135668/m.329787 type:complete len:342 (-) Transcript_135668:101-1126(-)
MPSVLCQAKANLLLLPVVLSVVLSQHRLTPDEELGTQRRGQIYGHERGPAGARCALPVDSPLLALRGASCRCLCGGLLEGGRGWRGGLGEHLGVGTRLLLRAGLGIGLCLLGEEVVLKVDGLPRIVPRFQGQYHIADLEMQECSLRLPAVHLAVLARFRVQQGSRQLILQCVGEVLWHSQQRCARIHDSTALAVVAEVHGAVADTQFRYGHLPVAELRERHRRPPQAGGHELRRVAAKGDLAALLVTISEEDPKAWLLQAPLRREHAEEAEFGRQGEAVEAKAQDAIEGKGVEGLVRHLRGRDDADLHAVGLVPVLGVLGAAARVWAVQRGLGRRGPALHD